MHKILIALLEKEEVFVTELRCKTHLSKQATQRNLELLTYMRLINERRVRETPPKRYIALTQKGREAALILASLQGNPSQPNNPGKILKVPQVIKNYFI